MSETLEIPDEVGTGENEAMPAPDPAIQLDATSATIAIQSMNAIVLDLTGGMKQLAEDARRDYLMSKSRVDYAQAVAVRHVEESGSGRVRNLDATNKTVGT